MPDARRAYIFHSLKRAEEAETLRHVYGAGLTLIGAYTPRETRVDQFSKRITQSRHKFDAREYRARAEELIQRDEAEADEPLGQNVRSVFPTADVFVDASDAALVRRAVTRFVQLLFGNTFHTPTRDEFGMFQAWAAALRSADLGRQVGAAIATEEGEIVALGTNEVPKAGGGLYWVGDKGDGREFQQGHDTSHKRLRALLADVLRRLGQAGWLVEERARQPLERLVQQALSEGARPMAGAQLLSIIEFLRAVHAEGAALMDAAKRGVSVKGCTMYVTTFPCHECAKHIVAAGIQRVVYIHPYPKSAVADMYPDSIAVDQPGVRDKVSFEPFVGVAPRRYMDLFTMAERRRADGSVAHWDGRAKVPRLSAPAAAYLVQEEAEFTRLERQMVAKGLLAPAEPTQNN
jgi:cytidine deaminase